MRLAILIATCGVLVGAPILAPTGILHKAQAAVSSAQSVGGQLTAAERATIQKAAAALINAANGNGTEADAVQGLSGDLLALAYASAAFHFTTTDKQVDKAAEFAQKAVQTPDTTETTQISIGVTALAVVMNPGNTEENKAVIDELIATVDSAGGQIEGAFNSMGQGTSDPSNAAAVDQLVVRRQLATLLQELIDTDIIMQSAGIEILTMRTGDPAVDQARGNSNPPPPPPPPFSADTIFVIEPNPSQSGSPT